MIETESRKKHKYVAKEKITPTYTKYFYSMEEYRAWKNKKNAKVQEPKKNKSFLDNIKDAFSNIANTVTKAIDKGKKAIENVLKNPAKAIKKTFSQLVNKGKKAVDNVLKSIGGKTLSELNQPKYITKVKTPNGYRYFYDQEAYERFLNKGKNAVDKILAGKNVDLDDVMKSDNPFVKLGASIVDFFANKTILGNAIAAAAGAISSLFNKEEPIKEEPVIDPNKKAPERDNSDARLQKEYNLDATTGDEFQKDINDVKDLKQKDYNCSKDEDMALVNPFYDYELKPGVYTYEWTNNCGSASLAYELRRRGYDVEAGGMVAEPPDILDICELYNISQYEMNQGYMISNGDSKKIDNIEKEMVSKYGEGSRGQLAVYWQEGGGHSMVWECENNEIIVRDTQTNDKYDFKDVMEYVADGFYYRTDNIKMENIKLDTEDFYIINRED